MRGVEAPAGAPAAYVDLLTSLHRLNVLLSYRWMRGER